MTQDYFPPGWDRHRITNVLEHYDHQTEEEALAEDEATFATDGQTLMEIPNRLVPAVRELLAQHNP
jgi:hypothetical protein